MSELIKFSEVTRNNFLGVQLCNLLAQLRDENIAGNPIMDEQGERNIEVSLTINGHPVSFRSTIERMNGCYDWAVNQEAKKLFEDKLFDLNETICNLQKHVENEMKTRLGIDLDN